MLRMQREELFELFTTELVLSLYSKTFFVHSNFVFHSLLRVDNFFDHAQIISRIIFMELVHCLKQPSLLLDPCNVVHILVKDRNMLVARLLRYCWAKLLPTSRLLRLVVATQQWHDFFKQLFRCLSKLLPIRPANETTARTLRGWLFASRWCLLLNLITLNAFSLSILTMRTLLDTWDGLLAWMSD